MGLSVSVYLVEKLPHRHTQRFGSTVLNPIKLTLLSITEFKGGSTLKRQFWVSHGHEPAILILDFQRSDCCFLKGEKTPQRFIFNVIKGSVIHCCVTFNAKGRGLTQQSRACLMILQTGDPGWAQQGSSSGLSRNLSLISTQLQVGFQRLAQFSC